MKVGDLVKWTDYTAPAEIGELNEVEHIGIILKFDKDTMHDYADWHDMVVLSGGKQQRWTSWQCEVIHEAN